MSRHLLVGLLAISSLTLSAQTTQNRIPFIRSVGTGTVSVKPDQAKIDLSVVTQDRSAQTASSQNAALVTSVISQVTAILGPAADIKTISYSLTANYSYQQGQPPTLTGYTASNTVQATTSDLSIVGRIIDTGIQAGANQVLGLQFGLQNDSDARSQALKAATVQAKAHADAMAAGVGARTGSVQVIQEGYSTSTTLVPGLSASAAPSTPIISGSLTVQATVTLDVSLVQ